MYVFRPRVWKARTLPAFTVGLSWSYFCLFWSERSTVMSYIGSLSWKCLAENGFKTQICSLSSSTFSDLLEEIVWWWRDQSGIRVVLTAINLKVSSVFIFSARDTALFDICCLRSPASPTLHSGATLKLGLLLRLQSSFRQLMIT